MASKYAMMSNGRYYETKCINISQVRHSERRFAIYDCLVQYMFVVLVILYVILCHALADDLAARCQLATLRWRFDRTIGSARARCNDHVK